MSSGPSPCAGGLATALLVLAFLVARSFNPSASPGTPDAAPPPSPVVEAEVGPFADDLAAGPPVELVHPRTERGRRAFAFGAVCGHRIGIAVQIMACGRARAELLGFYSSPPDPRRKCLPESAYSRKQNLSVCWFDFTDEAGLPLDLLRLPGVHLRDLVP